MPRKRKVKIELGSHESLLNLFEDVYSDLYVQRNQILNDLSRMKTEAQLEDDHAIYQVYKTRASLHTVLTSNASSKLQLAKLISSFLDESKKSNEPSEGVSLEQLAMMRRIINEQKGLN